MDMIDERGAERAEMGGIQGFDPAERWVCSDPEYWNVLAASSLQDARVLYENDRLVACCLHCHEALERALKALLASMRLLTTRDDTHSLTRLANRAGLREGLGEEMWKALALMSGMRQRTSYPNSNHVWRCLNDPGYVTMIWSNTLRIYRWLYLRQAGLDGDGLGEGGPDGV